MNQREERKQVDRHAVGQKVGEWQLMVSFFEHIKV